MNFTHPTFLSRYYAVLDAAIPEIYANGGIYVVLANEFDIYLSSETTEYQNSFVDFTILCKNYIQNTLGYHNLSVGVTTTHKGLVEITDTKNCQC